MVVEPDLLCTLRLSEGNVLFEPCGPCQDMKHALAVAPHVRPLIIDCQTRPSTCVKGTSHSVLVIVSLAQPPLSRSSCDICTQIRDDQVADHHNPDHSSSW